MADYIDGSQPQLQAVNDVTTVDVFYVTQLEFNDPNPDTIIDPNGGFVDAGFAGRRPLDRFGNQRATTACTRSRRSTADTMTLASGGHADDETVASGARLRW